MHKGGMKVTLEQKILMALVYRKMTQTELANKLGMSISNFNQRLKRGSFKVDEIEKIAEILGAKFTYTFDFEDGTKI